MRRLRIHAEAANEAAEAAAWYEKERPGLGEDFFRAVDAALDLLEEEIVPLVAERPAPLASSGCCCGAFPMLSSSARAPKRSSSLLSRIRRADRDTGVAG